MDRAKNVTTCNHKRVQSSKLLNYYDDNNKISLISDINLLHIISVRTRTDFMKGGFEWTRPKMWPPAITKTNARRSTLLISILFPWLKSGQISWEIWTMPFPYIVIGETSISERHWLLDVFLALRKSWLYLKFPVGWQANQKLKDLGHFPCHSAHSSPGYYLARWIDRSLG